jgi:adenylate kinase
LSAADVYHTTFDMPSNSEVAGRLEEPAGNSEEEVVEALVQYHRDIQGLLLCYHDHKLINADQPKADVFSQGMGWGKRGLETACRKDRF